MLVVLERKETLSSVICANLARGFSRTLAAGQMYHLPDSDRYIEFHSVLMHPAVPVLLQREWHRAPLRPHCLGIPINPLPPLLHIPYRELERQWWTRLTTASAARSFTTQTRRHILFSSPCTPPTPAPLSSVLLPPPIVAFVETLQSLSTDSGYVYSLFTDGSYIIHSYLHTPSLLRTASAANEAKVMLPSLP